MSVFAVNVGGQFPSKQELQSPAIIDPITSLMNSYIDAYNRFIIEILYKNYDNEALKYTLNKEWLKNLSPLYRRIFIHTTFTPISEFYSFNCSYNSKNFTQPLQEFMQSDEYLVSTLNHFIYSLNSTKLNNFSNRNPYTNIGVGAIEYVLDVFMATAHSIRTFINLSRLDAGDVGCSLILRRLHKNSIVNAIGCKNINQKLLNSLYNLEISLTSIMFTGLTPGDYFAEVDEEHDEAGAAGDYIFNNEKYSQYHKLFSKYCKNKGGHIVDVNHLLPLTIEFLTFRVGVGGAIEALKYYQYYGDNIETRSVRVFLPETCGDLAKQRYTKMLNNTLFTYVFNNLERLNDMPLEWFMELYCDFTPPLTPDGELLITFPEYSINYSTYS